jgi:hypothetical protein
MSARRNIAQRQMPPPQQARPVQKFVADEQTDGPLDIKKMHPMAVLSMHEERLNDIDAKISGLQGQSKKTSGGEESAMIAECIKQIKFLTQENQTNRNLTRELTLELLRLKTSLQEDGKIPTHISEQTQEKYEAFKETANKNQSQQQQQNVREELIVGEGNTVSFTGNGYDPNSL